MRLSYKDIENIAVKSFAGFMTMPVSEKDVRHIQIETYATHRLRLRIEYTRLSDDGITLGITTYTDTEIELRRYLRKEIIQVSKDTALIDERLAKPKMWGEHDRELNRRRFTIAHECAHQILYRMEPDERRAELDLRYSSRVMSLRELKSLDDWREWQANALAAALLMPRKHLDLLLGNRKLLIFGKRMNKPDKLFLMNMCNRLGVSPTALTLRLKQLGLAVMLPADAFFDPADIECDSDEFSIRGIGGMAHAG